MKKIKFFLFICFLLLLYGCGTENDTELISDRTTMEQTEHTPLETEEESEEQIDERTEDI